jgi:dipeptidyl aminopeptidase/acylaminoacyl peptidase
MPTVAEYRDFEPTIRFRPALSLSPDGTRLAYIDDAQGQFNVTIHPLDGGPARHLTADLGASARRVAWHPDGRSLLYIADADGDEHHQLYLVDADDGAVTALTNSPGVTFWPAQGAPFSPDGKLLAYAGADRTPSDQDVLVRDMPTGEIRRVHSGGGRVYAGHWSPDGSRLTLVDWRGAMTDQTISVLSIEDGQTTRLTPVDDSATYLPGPWLPDSSGVLVLTTAGRDATGLAVLDATSGDLSWLDTPPWDVEEVAVSSDGSTLAWLVNVDGASQLRIRDLGTGADLPTPTLPAGAAENLTLSADGRYAIVLMSTPTRPTNILVIDRATDTQRWLTDARPAVDPATFVEPELIRCPSPEGHTVPAYLYRPRVAGRVPVVLAVHGGPPVQERPNYSNDGLFQFLVTRGVAVLAPNIRGSRGYGLTYQTAVHRDWGGIDLTDIDAVVKYLKEQLWVDPDRIGLIGRSYGGFVVLSGVSRLPEHNWAAAVAWCGPSNLLTFSRAQPPSWRTQVAILIGDPDTDAEFLLERSPITYTDQITAPLFIIQGANDMRVPRHESDQIVQRLRTRGVEVRYDIYPDEGHAFGKRSNQTKARSDAADFLIRHLVRPHSRPET